MDDVSCARTLRLRSQKTLMVFGLFLEPSKSYLLLFGIIFTGFLLEIDTNYLAKEIRA